MAEKKVNRYKAYGIGLSFIVALVLFIWGFNFLKGNDILGKETVYFSEYYQVNGLVKANPVMINGLRVGKVKDIYFNPDMSGRIIVSFTLSNDFPVPVNSVARIFSSDLMGSKAIDLVLGDSKQFAHDGDTVKSQVEAGLMAEVNAQVQPIKKKAEDLLASMDTLVVAFQSIFNESARDNLKESFNNIRMTFENLENATGNIDNLVVTESGRISSILIRLDSLALILSQNKQNFNQIISNFKLISDSLAQSDIPATFSNINTTVAEMQKLLSSIEQGKGTLGQLMVNDSLYNQLNNSAASLDSLLRDVRENPKRYVKFSVF
ncbi:MAG: MCE family protein [Bacteroidetes bacterium HGW-Bacteroidetes-16]|jgi:phospholipid/cholesterol/gamma-HCH transport system substrate-binding protein|nr:MAG: MCE family protein [Bacteroidetes bacterium HGW-Bacteroidetes-16]